MSWVELSSQWSEFAVISVGLSFSESLLSWSDTLGYLTQRLELAITSERWASVMLLVVPDRGTREPMIVRWNMCEIRSGRFQTNIHKVNTA